MLDFKSGTLSKKEKEKVNSILSEIVDVYGDFYITKENLRLYIKQNPHLLYEGVSKGNKIIWGEEGILLVDGFADSYQRKYVKVLSSNESNASQLIKILNWNLNDTELYVKVKKENPICRAFQKNGFKFAGNRGKEILLCRKPKLGNFKANKEGDK